jgi:hypothetical protein
MHTYIRRNRLISMKKPKKNPKIQIKTKKPLGWVFEEKKPGFFPTLRPGARPYAARARGPREGARAQLPHLRQDLRDGEQPAQPREDNARGQDGDLHRLLGTGRVAVRTAIRRFFPPY